MKKGRSSKVAKAHSMVRRSYPVDECINEDSEESDAQDGFSESEYSDSEEDKNETHREDGHSRMVKRDCVASANPKTRAYVKRQSSMPRNESIPTMSRHVRRHKKIPGSVRKPTNDTVLI